MLHRFTLLALLTIFPAYAVAQAPKGGGMPSGTKVVKDVAYGKHERNKLDVFTPPSEKPLPLVIWIHGGGWEAGSKENNPATALLAQGYAVAGINYRYSTQAPFPAQLHDCQAAIRFLRDNAKKYNIDPDHVGVWGASAGGHLVSLLGTAGDVPELDGDPKSTTSMKIQAVVNWFGPTDLARMSPAGAPANPITKLLGGGLPEKAELAKSANPITHVSKGDAPFLIVHGDNDRLVPLVQSELLHEALKKTGVASELVVFPKAGHGDGPFREAGMKEDHRKKLIGFLDKYLKP